jgi:RHH-type transcriptional regulator, rel operon repressor / antitoxin RelB
VRGAAGVASELTLRALVSHCIARYYAFKIPVSRETISFRLESEKREALDAVASALDRDRSYIINEAIEAYLDVQRWQMEHIRKGLRQADAGKFATEAEMKKTFSRRRK